jgi:hypothetical protein
MWRIAPMSYYGAGDFDGNFEGIDESALLPLDAINVAGVARIDLLRESKVPFVREAVGWLEGNLDDILVESAARKMMHAPSPFGFQNKTKEIYEHTLEQLKSWGVCEEASYTSKCKNPRQVRGV